MIFRTDLALERRDIYNQANNLENDLEGIECNEEKPNEKLSITRVRIKDEEGEKALGKPIGKYITLDIKGMKYMEEDELENVSKSISNELTSILDEHIGKQDSVLIVGLGNEYVTPDSLGPKVASNLEVTRHVIKYCPQYVKEGTREISAVSPGVLGVTGIETLEIVKGLVENVKPKLLIAIDSLCSKNIERINKSIQISDTGIVPGGGVDNKRMEISRETLGIPVIAIGVPTVLDAATIVNDTLKVLDVNILEEDLINKMKLNNFNFIVTPKEIDELIDNMSYVLSEGINLSF